LSSFGEELRKQRELRQITLQEIAETTNVNLRFLEALERDDFDTLPGGLFTRGFIRAYADHVGLDVEATVNAYLYEIGQARTEENPRAHRNPALPRLQSGRRASPHPRPPAWSVVAALALGSAALLWWVLPSGRNSPEKKENEMLSQTQQTQEIVTRQEHVLELVAVRPVQVRVTCGAVDLLERRMEKDERLTFPCEGRFQLHAPRGDSLQVRWDGESVASPSSPLSGWNPAEGTP